jgi:predicted metal-binding protein
MVDFSGLVDMALLLGAGGAGVVFASDIEFSEEFRELCEQNYCGKFGTNWMCPPAVDSFEDCKARIRNLDGGVVFQTIYKLEDSFDVEGMVKAAEVHEVVFRKILGHIKSDSKYPDVLALNVGDCKACKKCTYTDGEPCRFPDKAVASVEAYCIDVNALLTSCGLAYNNGPDTVSYVGLFLF